MVVHYDANDDVCNSDSRLTEYQRLGVLSWIPHLGRDGEKERRASIGKHKSADGGDGVGKARVVGEFVVGYPDSFLGGF